jgi:hypothetical protein
LRCRHQIWQWPVASAAAGLICFSLLSHHKIDLKCFKVYFTLPNIELRHGHRSCRSRRGAAVGRGRGRGRFLRHRTARAPRRMPTRTWSIRAKVYHSIRVLSERIKMLVVYTPPVARIRSARFDRGSHHKSITSDPERDAGLRVK